MLVNFEFFDDEPIENVITCLHYKFDKVIFFGEKKMLDGRKDYTEKFLHKHCNIKEISFIEISASNPNKVVEAMTSAIQKERDQQNDCYFDITGGEGLSLFAFGALSKELDVPVHMYNIVQDELLEFNKKSDHCISKNVPSQHILLNLEKLIEMHGGQINTTMSKSFKHQHTSNDLLNIQSLWDLSHQFSREWNQFANFLAEYAQELNVSLDIPTVRNGIANRTRLNLKKLSRILDACADNGVLCNVSHTDECFSFSYCSDFVKKCMCDSGSVLEQYTFLMEKTTTGNNDCRIGVHIDWDGIFHTGYGNDVLNEIDVLSLYGNISVFISCKNGKVDQHAMYELQTVAEQFGGKYARKMLVVTKPLTHGHMLRAKEMNIEVKVL
ncbi:MAG: DUF1887 family protein [Roseburia sp.]|nr:DUF1887 family protein [Roseburia sp.]